MGQDLEINGEKTSVGTSRRGSNQSGMRAYNERLVLSLIRQEGSMTKAQITRQTGLSAQTVSVIMRALEGEGLLIRGEPVRGKIGQPSVPLSLAADGAFFFGLKVGRRSLELVLTDFLGAVVHRLRVSHPYPAPDTTVQFVMKSVDEILAKLPEEHRARIAGLGIAMPFQLWDWADTMSLDAQEMRDWKDRDIASEIEAAWHFPVFICNDASTACGAELVFGDQKKSQDFLYFFVGFFIGGGLVLDTGLYTGRTGNAAALGSMMVPTTDGTVRQLVDVASLAVLEKTLAATGDQASMIWETPEAWDIPEAALEQWLDSAAQAIAHATVSSICLVDVGHVLIDGWMPDHMRTDLVRRTQRAVAEIKVAGVDNPEVIAGSIGPDARALGAASLPLSKRFLVEKNSYQKGPTK